jgi:hypothetical protein
MQEAAAMSVRARFYVQSVNLQAGDNSIVSLNAVTRGKENSEWSAYTSSGQLTLTLSRKASPARDYFMARIGKEVFLDISDADTPVCTQCGEPCDDPDFGTTVRGADGAYVAGEWVHNACMGEAKARLGLGE